MLPTTPPALRSLRRAVSRRRRLVGAVLLAAAVAVGLETLAPSPPATRTVVVAARDLAAGTALAADDLAPVGLPPDAVPEGSRDSPEQLTGRVLGSPARRGEPLTDVRVVGAPLVAGYGAGLVAAPVRIAEPGAVRLLQPGSRVDVLAAAVSEAGGGGPAEVVARGSPVVVVPAPEQAEAADGALVVLAVTPQTAAVLATAAVRSRLTVVLRS